VIVKSLRLFNSRRLHSQLYCILPEEYATTHYAQIQASQPAMPRQ